MIRYLSNITGWVALILVPLQSLTAQVKEYPINYIVEEMPLFENSDPAVSFSRYIQEQVDNLSLQIPDSISERIDVHFWIDTIGNVVDPAVIRSLSESLDSLACKIVLDSPGWIPGRQRGQTVRVGFTFPVYINMDDPKHTVY
jgi:protein TonB